MHPHTIMAAAFADELEKIGFAVPAYALQQTAAAPKPAAQATPAVKVHRAAPRPAPSARTSTFTPKPTQALQRPTLAGAYARPGQK
jgi:hypothetical protein